MSEWCNENEHDWLVGRTHFECSKCSAVKTDHAGFDAVRRLKQK